VHLGQFRQALLGQPSLAERLPCRRWRRPTSQRSALGLRRRHPALTPGLSTCCDGCREHREAVQYPPYEGALRPSGKVIHPCFPRLTRAVFRFASRSGSKGKPLRERFRHALA
jgi:hypothetical protein